MGRQIRHQPTMLGHAVCTKCEVEKPVEDFPVRKHRKSGHGSWCKPCLNAHMKEKRDQAGRPASWWTYGRKDKIIARSCSLCGEITMRDQMDKWLHKCMRCDADRNAQWRDENPERHLRAKIDWAKRNPDKVDAAALRRAERLDRAGIYEVSSKDLRKLQALPCGMCGELKPRMSIDHIIPIARGGRHAIGNLARLCKSCNSQKNDRLNVEVRYGKRRQRGKRAA